MERESDEAADNRREAAIASSASLRPNFKPKNGITDSQLSKFQELHKRRLQIKAKAKVKKKNKTKVDEQGITHKAKGTDMRLLDVSNQTTGDSPAASVKSESLGEDHVAANSAAKTHQKLYWGLDAKERWERKSNM